MTKIDVPSENVDIKKLYGLISPSNLLSMTMQAYLANIFLLMVPAQVAICSFLLASMQRQAKPVPTFELLSNICQLFVDALLFEFTSSRISKIGNELDKSTHVRVAAARPAQEAGWPGRRHGDKGFYASP